MPSPAKLYIHKLDRLLGRRFAAFKKLADQYGDKVAGLAIVPSAWTPSFVGLPTKLHSEWLDTTTTAWDAIKSDLQTWLDHNSSPHGYLLRSSGVDETVMDRGRLQTTELQPNVSAEEVRAAAIDIFEHARRVGFNNSVGLLIQVRLQAEATGDLSNETSLTPTRNQWKYEIVFPSWAPMRGINSKRAPHPDAREPLRGDRPLPHLALRSLGQWVNKSVAPRSHIEWVLSDGKLWVVQLDLEWWEKDIGVDPLDELHILDVNAVPERTGGTFQTYKLGTETPFTKLANLNDFDFSEDMPHPKLFYATAEQVAVALNNRSQFALEIAELTHDRCVLRTDVLQGTKKFNLPRTDTCTSQAAVDWLEGRVGSIPIEQRAKVAFVMHSFIPARAAVWAYAEPKGALVLIDALWGLPDGLQILPHDSFQVDVARNKIVSEKIRYKPRFLKEDTSGAWHYVDVMASKARQRALGSKDILEISERTAKIADRLNEATQIMWFCGVPESYAVGNNIPWYRARETSQPSPRIELNLKPFDVRNYEDLGKLPQSAVTIRLIPDAPLVRNDDFLDAVIEKAKQFRSVVSLQGSRLGHAYHKLCSANVPIVLNDPISYFRKRGRRTFGKLVRDKIPSGIAKRGELVIEATLAPNDIVAGLISKLCEEGYELLSATNGATRLEELADISEVVHSLIDVLGVNDAAVLAAQMEKREDRGGFEQRRVLLETSLPMPGNQEKSIPEVSLREISHVEMRDGNPIVPFAALFAHPSGVEIAVGGNPEPSLKIRVVPGGIRIEQHAPGTAASGKQMDLFGDTPKKAT